MRLNIILIQKVKMLGIHRKKLNEILISIKTIVKSLHVSEYTNLKLNTKYKLCCYRNVLHQNINE